MKREEYLWVVLMEECAEIQQAAAKILRFGLDDTHPEYPEMTNEQQILDEYYQLVAVMDILQEQSLLKKLPAESIEQIKSKKRKKVEKYLMYSRERGYVE